MYTREIPSIDLGAFIMRVLTFLTGVALMGLLIAWLFGNTGVSPVLLLIIGAMLVGFTIQTLFVAIERMEISNSPLCIYTIYLAVGVLFPGIGTINLFRWLFRKKVSESKSTEERKLED